MDNIEIELDTDMWVDILVAYYQTQEEFENAYIANDGEVDDELTLRLSKTHHAYIVAKAIRKKIGL